MRHELEILEKIDEFLDGKCSKAQLLISLNDNKLELEEMIEIQRLLRNAMQKDRFIAQSKKALSRFKLVRRFKLLALIVLSAIVLTTLFLVLAKEKNSAEQSSPSIFPETVKDSLISNQMIDPEFPKINEKNTVIEILKSKDEINSLRADPIPTTREIESKERSSKVDSAGLQIKNRLTIETLRFGARDERRGSIATKYSKSISHIKVSLHTLEYPINEETAEHFKLKIIDGRGQNVLDSLFRQKQTANNLSESTQHFSSTWFLIQKTLPPGKYTAEMYFSDQLMASDTFVVY